MSHYLLAIDQGTTSSRAIVFSAQGLPLARAQQEFKQYFPKDGWVEHDAEEIWLTTLKVCREALAQEGLQAQDIRAIGITNQRETTIVWDVATGTPIHPAIVWQDRRTADYCAELKDAGHEAQVAAKTGLLIDPYFSATKLRWILDNVPGARERAERGELRFGTVDCFLLWRLTAARTGPMPATPRAPCCSISTASSGTRSCWPCSTSRAACCRRCWIAPPTSAPARPSCSVRRLRCWAWPATSRRR
jgi:glycerol kinase